MFLSAGQPGPAHRPSSGLGWGGILKLLGVGQCLYTLHPCLQQLLVKKGEVLELEGLVKAI